MDVNKILMMTTKMNLDLAIERDNKIAEYIYLKSKDLGVHDTQFDRKLYDLCLVDEDYDLLCITDFLCRYI